MPIIKQSKKIAILGSTGSIGQQSLEVIKKLGYQICGLAVKKNIELLKQQILEFQPKIVAVFDENKAEILKKDTEIRLLNLKILTGMNGLLEVATLDECDIILNALTGMIGLSPTLAAISNKKNIAIANKETLVAGGKIVIDCAKKNNVKILPIDSEHSAIFQCLKNENIKKINKLILTASGGPFFGKNIEFLKKVTLEDSLKHPNWQMGPKNTIDSATLINKGLELIEASNLFEISAEKIEILIHRESIVHSMVEFCDGSIIAQMSQPDMKLPIEYALTYPSRQSQIVSNLDLTRIKNLSFSKPDLKTFQGLKICIDAAKFGHHMPIVINAANEELVNLFLDKKIQFLDIVKFLNSVYNHFISINFKHESLEEILIIDKLARDFTHKLIFKNQK